MRSDASASTAGLWARRGLGTAGWAVLIGCAGYLVAIALGRTHYLAELASMFRYEFGLGAAGGLVPLLALRQWRRAALVAAVAVWALWPEASLGLRSQPCEADTSSPRLRVVMANVLRPNVRRSEVLEAVLSGSPDVIGLIEVSPAWRAAALKRLGDLYPHHVEGLNTTEWTGGTWALMLFSKSEIVASRVVPIEHWGMRIRPVLEATIAAPFQVSIQLAHPERPGTSDRLDARRKALDALGAADIEGHRILIGDLNTTSTSPYFDDLIQAAGLRDSRLGFGRLCSWFLGGRLPGPLPLSVPPQLSRGVTIDHALVSSGLYVEERGVRHLPGSDHWAVTLGVRLAM